MGYTIKQKIEICLQSEANPQMTQMDLATWAMNRYNSANPPSQTTISRILSSKFEILGAKESEFQLVRRRKVSNPLLRFVLTEWITQAYWERIPITTPIIQSTANAIWNKLESKSKDGNGVFNHKWCNHFVKRLNVNLTGSRTAIEENIGFPLNKVWRIDEKVDLKQFIASLISLHNYSPKDLFTIDEFQLFYCLPLDQIFDVSSIDKGLNQSGNPSESALTIMLGCNIDGSEKLHPMVVSKQRTFNVSGSSHPVFKSHSGNMQLSSQALANKLNDAYQISYKHNNNIWITSSVFQDYLLSLDHKLESVSPNRNIVIFLDDSSTHRIINLEFKHIRLVFMENSSKHKNPYSGSFDGVKFDFIPMSFGIVEEFKILFRLQQYLEMINKQRNRKDGEKITSGVKSSKIGSAGQGTDILSEEDYRIPLIKALEWIKRSWESISQHKIYSAWKRSHIVDFKKAWPASDPEIRRESDNLLEPFRSAASDFDLHKSYEKLREIQEYLNVVIPWEINDLLGLVNERAKVSLNYASIDEMINSCASSTEEGDSGERQAENTFANSIQSDQMEVESSDWLEKENATTETPKIPTPNLVSTALLKDFSPNPNLQLNSFQEKLPPMMVMPRKEIDFSDRRIGNKDVSGKYGSSNMSALLLATNTSQYLPMQNKTNNDQLSPNPSMVSPFSTPGENSLGIKHRLPESDLSSLTIAKRPNIQNSTNALSEMFPYSYSGSPVMPVPQMNWGKMENNMTSLPQFDSLPKPGSDEPKVAHTTNEELVSTLSKVLDAANNNGIKLSYYAVEEIKFNLASIRSRISSESSFSRPA